MVNCGLYACVSVKDAIEFLGVGGGGHMQVCYLGDEHGGVLLCFSVVGIGKVA
jgi:hypothetical protein